MNAPRSRSRRPDAQAVFDRWATWRSAGDARPLSAASVAKYEAIWGLWVRFLRDRKRSWHAADEQDVHAFLAALQPRASVRGLDTPSHVSRTRYLRALRAVYAHAVLQDWIAANPAEATPEGARTEEADSFVLNAAHRAALRRHLPAGDGWLAVRDRALLHLLMDAALTVAELRTLRVAQLQLGPGRRAELRLDGPRAAQRRALDLPEAAVGALRRWLLVRGTAAQDEPVFVSRKGHAMLSARAVFHVVSAFVLRTLHACGECGAVAHVGPNVLRNSALVQWLDEGLAAGEVARRAGLESTRMLLRLAPHCLPADRDAGRDAGTPGAGNDTGAAREEEETR
ncbi:tyrosine-type recombinase/integrase [Caldimonas tepidiphila]|uniref:tyrosine-type recombinase/integrase n=1 Tax=Caldimonas tepidiphila TaxID=2315841 RepID=UPI0014760F12|nr:tyrosine-type recombinase/integrase [Caldimonas tepidiphila]